MRGNSLVAAYQSTPSPWLPDMVIAEDVHSESGRLDIVSDAAIGSDPVLVLTLTKLVKKGELLKFWFSSELAAKLGFPFLNFSHIKDGQYYCSNCSRKFDAPNPLKLHIATSCEAMSTEDLWSRLWNTFPHSSYPWAFPKLAKENTITPKGHSRIKGQLLLSINEKSDSRPLSPDSSSSHQSKESKIKSCSVNLRHSSHLTHSKSAFRPVPSTMQNNQHSVRHEHSTTSLQNNCFNLFGNNTIHGMFSIHPLNSYPLTSLGSNPLMKSSSLNQLKWPPLPTSSSPSGSNSPHVKPLVRSPHPLFDSLPSTSSSDPYAEVETLVSSLGRGKGSHLCLYCGKVYSRKYGLKIHIRTHTGYKPLKCRVCLRPFGDPSNLNKHVRLHAQGDTPYRCDLCGKVLVRKRDLDRHLRSRHSRESIEIMQNARTGVSDPDDDDCDDLDIDVEGSDDQLKNFQETTSEVNVQT